MVKAEGHAVVDSESLEFTREACAWLFQVAQAAIGYDNHPDAAAAARFLDSLGKSVYETQLGRGDVGPLQ